MLCFSSLKLELVLKRNLCVTENRTVQLDYQVNDTTYPGLEGTVLLHFNVTILPVHIHFTNITHMFSLTRRASDYAQVGYWWEFYLTLDSLVHMLKRL